MRDPSLSPQTINNDEIIRALNGVDTIPIPDNTEIVIQSDFVEPSQYSRQASELPDAWICRGVIITIATAFIGTVIVAIVANPLL